LDSPLSKLVLRDSFVVTSYRHSFSLFPFSIYLLYHLSNHLYLSMNTPSNHKRYPSKRKSRPRTQSRVVDPRQRLVAYDANFVIHRKRMRFSAPTAAPVDAPTLISTTDMFNLLVVIGPGGVGLPIITAFRIRSVAITAPFQTVSSFCSVEFVSSTSGNVGARPLVHSDTSLSTASPSFVFAKPSYDSAPSQWQNREASTNTTGADFLLRHSANCVIDVVLDIVIQNGQTPPAPLPSFVGAVTGQVLLNNLDNTSTNLIVPSDYTH